MRELTVNRGEVFFEYPHCAAQFLSGEVEFERPLTPRGKEIYAIGRDYGWREVVGIPIHGPAGYQGYAYLALQMYPFMRK